MRLVAFVLVLAGALTLTLRSSRAPPQEETAGRVARLRDALTTLEAGLTKQLDGSDDERAAALSALCAVGTDQVAALPDRLAPDAGRATRLALLGCGRGVVRPLGEAFDRLVVEAFQSEDRALGEAAQSVSFVHPPEFRSIWNPDRPTYYWAEVASASASTIFVHLLETGAWNDPAWAAIPAGTRHSIEYELEKERRAAAARAVASESRANIARCPPYPWPVEETLTTAEIKRWAFCDPDKMFWSVNGTLAKRGDPFTSDELTELERRFTPAVEPRIRELLRMERWTAYAREARFDRFGEGLTQYARGELKHEDDFSEALDRYGRGPRLPERERRKMLAAVKLEGAKFATPGAYGVLAGADEESALWERLFRDDSSIPVLIAAGECDSPRCRELKRRLQNIRAERWTPRSEAYWHNDGTAILFSPLPADDRNCPSADLTLWNVFGLQPAGIDALRAPIQAFLLALQSLYPARERTEIIADFLRVRSGVENLDGPDVAVRLLTDRRALVQSWAIDHYRRFLPRLNWIREHDVGASAERTASLRAWMADTLGARPRLSARWTSREERWWNDALARWGTAWLTRDLSVYQPIDERSYGGGRAPEADASLIGAGPRPIPGGIRLFPDAARSLLEDADARRRLVAAEGLWSYERSTEARTALVRLSADPLAAIRARAVHALTMSGVPGDIGSLTERLQDPDPVVRRITRVAVARTAPPDVLNRLQDVPEAEIDGPFLEALARRPDRLAARVADRWLEAAPWPRLDELLILGRVRTRAHLEHLLSRLSVPDAAPRTQGRILRVLAEASFGLDADLVPVEEGSPAPGAVERSVERWRTRLTEDPATWLLRAVEAETPRSRQSAEGKAVLAAWSAQPASRPSLVAWATGAGSGEVDTLLGPALDDDLRDSARLRTLEGRRLLEVMERPGPLQDTPRQTLDILEGRRWAAARSPRTPRTEELPIHERLRRLSETDPGDPATVRCDLRPAVRRAWADALRSANGR